MFLWQRIRQGTTIQKMKNIKFSLFGELKGVTGSFQTTPTNELSFKELIEYYNSKQNKELSLALLN